ncbi:hypothetical protein V3Q77_14570, partial [Flavobacterium davisii]
FIASNDILKKWIFLVLFNELITSKDTLHQLARVQIMRNSAGRCLLKVLRNTFTCSAITYSAKCGFSSTTDNIVALSVDTGRLERLPT